MRLRPHRGRRTFLARLGAVASAGLFLPAGPTVLRRACAAREAGEPLRQPAQIASADGVLSAAIAAAPGRVRLGAADFSGLLYNGDYLPPVLRARLGDTMRIRFRNDLPRDPSNLHFHGMSVSPRGNSDNVFVHVHPGGVFDYEVRIPARGRQRPGLFWYHPHAHGFVAKQVLGGMSGGLVVDGFDQLFPIMRGLPERFLFLKHAKLGGATDVVSINGQVNPAVELRPGEPQFWRIAHIGATQFMRLKFEGVALFVLATDGHPLSRPRRQSEFFLGPGQRIDAVAVGPAAGEYAIRTLSFQNEAWRKPEPALRLGRIVAEGAGPARAGVEAEILRARVIGPRWLDDVRTARIARRRRLAYSRTADRSAFMIDGHAMDERRIDQTVKLGDTEEWTIVNTDQQFHSFHIHQTGFLVTEVNGVARHEDSMRDTFSIPPATAAGPGLLKVVIPFTDPVITGRFVYHCHAVNHEDKGMMGIVEVVA